MTIPIKVTSKISFEKEEHALTPGCQEAECFRSKKTKRVLIKSKASPLRGHIVGSVLN